MKSISCIIPIYGLNKGDNWNRFVKLIISLSEAWKNMDNSSFELIIVDDDPNEPSEERIRSLIETKGLSTCLKYISNKVNLGQSRSRNIGAEVSMMEYLHFIDQDDFVSENYYSEFKNFNECVIDLYIYRPLFYIEGLNKAIPATTKVLDYYYNKYRTLQNLWFLLFSNVVYSPGQVLMKKNVFMRNNGFPFLKNYGSDDYGLFYKLVFKNHLNYVYLSKAHFYYRIHHSQSSRHCDMTKSVCEFFDSIISDGIKEKMVRLFKTSNYLSFVSKIFYILCFKRVNI